MEMEKGLLFWPGYLIKSGYSQSAVLKFSLILPAEISKNAS